MVRQAVPAGAARQFKRRLRTLGVEKGDDLPPLTLIRRQHFKCGKCHNGIETLSWIVADLSWVVADRHGFLGAISSKVTTTRAPVGRESNPRTGYHDENTAAHMEAEEKTST